MWDANRLGSELRAIAPALPPSAATSQILAERDPIRLVIGAPPPAAGGSPSSKLSDTTAELQGSLRTLGSNILHLAKSQAKDARSVAAAPRKLLSATRLLVPRLAEHVSPSKLLASMVRDLNESIQAQVDLMDVDDAHPHEDESMSLAAAPGRVCGVLLPTEDALREHNQGSCGPGGSAAEAAEAVLRQLPPSPQETGHETAGSHPPRGGHVAALADFFDQAEGGSPSAGARELSSAGCEAPQLAGMPRLDGPAG